MMNTVNADLKKGQTLQSATVNKTKQIVVEAEKKFKEDHTFKPQINEFNLPPSKEMSKDERWKKLTEPKTVLQQQRERLKTQIEVEETQKYCTFKPQISKSARKLQSANKENSDSDSEKLPLPQRLMHEADLRKEKREKLKRELEQQQMRECSFKP